MKKLHFFVIVTLVLLGISSRLYSDYPKLPLLERWTGASCDPCAGYNATGYEEWTTEHRNEIAIITWHTNASGNDPFYTTDRFVTDWRTILYNTMMEGEAITAVPEVKWNGRHPLAANGEVMPGNPSITDFNRLLAAEANKTTPMQIIPTLTIEGDTAIVNVKIHTTWQMDNIKLRIVLVESAVNFSTPPGSNGERVFPYVAKYLVPDSAGTSLTLKTDEHWERTYKQGGMTNKAKVTDINRMYVVAFVEEMTKEHNIVQAALSCETIPYPAIYEAKTEATQNYFYSKFPHGELVTHTLQIANVDDYEIAVVPRSRQIISGQNKWEIVESTVPTETFLIPAKTTRTYEYSVVHSGDRPSSAAHVFDFDCIMSEGAIAELKGIALNKVISTGFIDMTDDIKYAFITGLSAGDDYSYGAFSYVTHFGNELIAIPSTDYYFPHPTLLTGNFLDNLEFLGFSPNMWTWIYDMTNDDPNTPNVVGVDDPWKRAFQKKLKSMTNTRIFMSNDPMTIWRLTDTSKGGNSPDGQENSLDRAETFKFFADEFGFKGGQGPKDRKPWMISLFSGTSTASTFPRTIFAEEGDSISLVKPALVINNSGYKDLYLGAFDSLTENAKPVYNYYKYIYEQYTNDMGTPDDPSDDVVYNKEDDKGNLIIKDSALTKNVMIKWERGNLRRVTSNFNYGMLSEVGLEDSDAAVLANSIVDWMFAPVSIEDGETNMSTKNGLLLRTYPNPVTSVSDVIVQNTNVLPVSGKVYLLDMSGAHVMDLFNGTLNIGDNNIQLSNSNLTAGKYFVVSETDAGKTFMSVVISK